MSSYTTVLKYLAILSNNKVIWIKYQNWSICWSSQGYWLIASVKCLLAGFTEWGFSGSSKHVITLLVWIIGEWEWIWSFMILQFMT